MGDYAFWYSLDGFFWFPRTLFGIENHFFAFYDYPELMTRMNEDLCAYYKKVLAIVNEETEPVFMTFAEDMSYNHGPMCSYAQYAQFVLPYYRQLTPLVRAGGYIPAVDHQTPPDVTVENYRIFVRLLREISYAPDGPGGSFGVPV